MPTPSSSTRGQNSGSGGRVSRTTGTSVRRSWQTRQSPLYSPEGSRRRTSARQYGRSAPTASTCIPASRKTASATRKKRLLLPAKRKTRCRTPETRDPPVRSDPGVNSPVFVNIQAEYFRRLPASCRRGPKLLRSIQVLRPGQSLPAMLGLAGAGRMITRPASGVYHRQRLRPPPPNPLPLPHPHGTPPRPRP